MPRRRTTTSSDLRDSVEQTGVALVRLSTTTVDPIPQDVLLRIITETSALLTVLLAYVNDRYTRISGASPTVLAAINQQRPRDEQDT